VFGDEYTAGREERIAIVVARKGELLTISTVKDGKMLTAKEVQLAGKPRTTTMQIRFDGVPTKMDGVHFQKMLLIGSVVPPVPIDE
jgi:hypothetical protein